VGLDDRALRIAAAPEAATEATSSEVLDDVLLAYGDLT
jgi:hypothetical protein